MRKLIFMTLMLAFSLNFLVFCQTGKKEQQPPLIPMEDFFKNPTKTSFKLSPDGEHIAFLQPWKSRLNVFVQKIGEEQATRITSAENRDIAGFAWANDQRIIYVQDKAGDENFKLYAVNIDGSNPAVLTPFEKVRVGIIDDLEDDPEHMIIQMNKRDPRVFDAYRININTGEMEMIAQNPGNISQWITDWQGDIRLAITTDGVNTSLLYRKDKNSPFKTILTTNFKETMQPLFFSFEDPTIIYAKSNLNRDKQALVKFDLDNARELEVIYKHPEVDIAGVMYSKKRKVLTGASYVTDRRRYVFFDDERRQLQTELEKLLPGYEVAVVDFNKNEDKCLVRTYSDKTRGSYFLYDLNSKQLTHLADISPWLKEEYMAEMQPITFKSRDGLTIHGYLTLPKGLEPKNLPVVVNPHGGPWYRDVWGFNPEVQFLANRGYAVLQINFRGSTGYGKKFWELSFKQWGKKMQDDITDGVQWLIKQGIADPKRIAIYGGSYGGYATLAGLAFTPDLYACGIDYVGVSNLFTFLNTIPPYWKPYLDMFHEMVGHPQRDSLLLAEASPVFHADKIKAPLFIAQGANDPRVNKAESDQMVEALRKRGVEVEYMVKDNEGHGFRNEENRFDFYRAMEKFLAEHLGGRMMEKQ
ncbi:putative dipeptidyl anminopeptidase [Caldithrix abyssi DSM 13497]|uniref:Dipeptidyl aminopeptidase/acylaminoacyl peptidase n=1 Tax=Caldithrix abyssi DSM 13497 TaxID=880073 RepID=H1XVQ5_CALAY|nr:S9 family peptidase [Caldithrix abyssi]APF20912.1 Dipeptidyl aminopeptidase/acylaminoacyl peptidase [Caldithrix abyssi DSM 13497]EHO40632.1 putative dipeptidyl anminopeptidase [Caldithrix abyssi DSM 13497]